MPRAVVERGGDVVGRDAVAGGRAHRLVVAGADDLAALHAAAGQQHEHGARVVVAAGVGVDLRRAAELAGDEDGRRLEQALVGERGEAGRQTRRRARAAASS